VSVLATLKARFNIFRRNLRWNMQQLYVSLPVQLNEQYPDFLCIGAPKSATTWLHKRMDMHPDVFLPKDKELHFFDTPFIAPSINSDLHSASKGLGYYKPHDLSSENHWRWYSFQFQKGKQQHKGDITPTYARASEENIELIVDKLPNIKIIYILRNPIERAWSGASYFMYRWYGKAMSEPRDDDFVKSWVLDAERLDHGFYMDKIKRWEKYLSKDNILYIFYDDIKKSPRNVLNQVCEFIGVDELKLPDSDGDSKKVNSGYPKSNITTEFWMELYDVYKDEIRQIEERFNRDLSDWKYIPK